LDVTLKAQAYANTVVTEPQPKLAEPQAKSAEVTAATIGDRVTLSDEALALSLSSDEGQVSTNNTGIEPPSSEDADNTGIEPPSAETPDNTGIEPPSADRMNTGIEPPSEPPVEPPKEKGN
jgi:hypothetical protein